MKKKEKKTFGWRKVELWVWVCEWDWR